MVLAIGFAYVKFGGLPWMQAVFYGVGAAVIGIISISSYKLTKKTIGKDYLLWGIFILLGVTTFITETEMISLVVAAGVLVWFVKAPPKFLKSINSFFSYFAYPFTNHRNFINRETDRTVLVFLKSRSICFRQWACYSSIFIWRSSK